MKTIISIILAGALVTGIYFAFNNKKTDESIPSNQQENTDESSVATTTTTIPSGKKMAFSQFVKQGGSYKCTVNQYLGAIGGASTKGITYLDKGMIRGEYNTQIQGMNIGTTVLVRDGYTYSWSSISPTTGFKAKVVSESKNNDTKTSGTYSYNTDQIGDYDCKPWTPVTSLFTIPAEVTFKEIGLQ